MDKRFLTGQVKAIDVEARTLTAYASTILLDRDDEVILPSAWTNTLESFMKNPVLPWAHDYRIPPVGKASDLEIDEKGLKFTAHFARTDFAEEIWGLYRDGFLNAFSVGFRPRKWEDSDDQGSDDKQPRRTYTECELLEISCVPIPANAHALVERGVPVIAFKSVTDFAMPEEIAKAAEPESAEPTEPTEPTEQPQPDDPPEPEELDAPADGISEELLDTISDYLEQVEQQLRDQGVINDE